MKRKTKGARNKASKAKKNKKVNVQSKTRKSSGAVTPQRKEQGSKHVVKNKGRQTSSQAGASNQSQVNTVPVEIDEEKRSAILKIIKTLKAVIHRKKFPKVFPFWARLKFAKNRTTLVIDSAPALDKKKKKYVPGFVHREATHTKGKGEVITPNPDKRDDRAMILKGPGAPTPQYLFAQHEKELDMPENLKARYKKNNKKRVDVPRCNNKYLRNVLR